MPLQTLADVLGDFIDWARGLLEDAQDIVTGQISNTVQAVLDIKEMDCGGKWTVYVKTAIPAAGSALYLLLTPSFEEILESYLHPKTGRRGGRRGRRGERERRANGRGQKRLFFGGGIPDVDNLIADSIVGRAFFKGRQIGSAEWLFWTGIDVADAVLWQWLLLEASETFATEWQSGLMESGQCIKGGPAYAKVQTAAAQKTNLEPFWPNPTGLPVALTHNMTVAVNGFTNLALPDTVMQGFAAVKTEWTFTNTSASGTAIYQVGFQVNAYPYNAPVELLMQEAETVTIPAGATVTAQVDGFAQYTLMQQFQFLHRFAVIQGGPIVTRSVVATAEVNAEALGNV